MNSCKHTLLCYILCFQVEICIGISHTPRVSPFREIINSIRPFADRGCAELIIIYLDFPVADRGRLIQQFMAGGFLSSKQIFRRFASGKMCPGSNPGTSIRESRKAKLIN